MKGPDQTEPQLGKFYQEHENAPKIFYDFDPKKWEKYVRSFVLADEIVSIPEMEMLLANVFCLIGYNGSNPDSEGTGVIIDSQGTWLTAYHVYNSLIDRFRHNESTEFLHTNDYGKLLNPPELVVVNKKADVVVLRSPEIAALKESGIRVAKAQYFKKGGLYYILGFPVNSGGHFLPYSRVPYLAIGEYTERPSRKRWQEIDASGWAGFSGSPVLDKNFELCGIMIRTQHSTPEDAKITAVPLGVFKKGLSR